MWTTFERKCDVCSVTYAAKRETSKYCSARCRVRASRKRNATPRTKKVRRPTIRRSGPPPWKSMPCAKCERAMWKGPDSQPEGKATCLTCRRQPKPPPPPKLCAECGAEIPRRRRYCDPCRDRVRGDSWSRRTITPNDIKRQREYRSAEHRAERAKVVALVESGEAFCWRCGGHIPPGSPVHTGHDDNDRDIYRGAEHPECNVRAGARKARSAAWQGRPRTFLQYLASSVEHVDQACVGCGETFTVRWPDQKYCDAACYQTNRPRIERKSTLSEHHCQLCGRTFEGRTRKYCGSDCALEANARRNRDRYRARVGLPVDPAVPTSPRTREAA